ncbi:tetratricopeptide repeat protein [uncultured Desulfosarcina sp.]|uniref:tetratricopeptide repeat protein n=1 Tax=uncultured Desulfosarcina sp. TaxID=218289 RepID=UPI0029C90937|nr:tetratricopeptide repeat protein [uncultured Desulfosarcina sp.]
MIKEDLKKAFVAHKSGNTELAYQLYLRVLQEKPQEADALHLIGVALHQMGRPENALDYLSQAISINKSNPIYYNSLGRILNTLEKYSQSIKCYEKSIRLAPRYAEPHYNLGTVCHALHKIEESIGHYQNAIRINPGFAEAHNNLGAALNEIGNFSEARESCLQAIRLKPDYPEAFNNLGNAQKELGEVDQAIQSYRRAIGILGECAEILGNLGNALSEAGKHDDAFRSYNRAIEIEPSNGKIYNNLGALFRSQGKLDDAVACFEKAIRLMPHDVEAYHNLGNIYYDRSEYKLAISCYQKALTYDPHSLRTMINLGICLQEKGDSEMAVDIFKQVLDYDPENEKACCHLAHEMYQRCQWDILDSINRKIDRFTDEKLKDGERPEEMPFLNLIRRSDPSINFKVAQKWSDLFVRANSDKRNNPRGVRVETNSKKLTIGYLSNNFRNHPTAQLTWKIFSFHDRQQFNVNVYSYGEDDSSEHRKRIKNDCDKFTDIRALDHRGAANCIYHDQVDILIDLVGYMRNHRLDIASQRPAPIQVRWLGLAGTTGADFFDYLITDRIVTPPEESIYYSEKFIYMPDTYQVNSGLFDESIMRFQRQDDNLPEEGFVYCSFCSSYKIEANVFGLWMKILKAVPKSILWLLKSNNIVASNLRKEAESRGVDPLRIIFAEKMPKENHLERLKMADLALDTLTVNGAATTSDALWVGIPVITMKGTHFASRMSASILNAIGMEDLVCEFQDTYKKKAIELGNNPIEIKTLKDRLRINRIEKPLFDTHLFVTHLEKAYLKIWERYRDRKEPCIIHVGRTK